MTLTTWAYAAGGETEDDLVRPAIRAAAPAEEPLLAFLGPVYRRRPGRWRRDPARLVRVGGGEAGGGASRTSSRRCCRTCWC